MRKTFFMPLVVVISMTLYMGCTSIDQGNNHLASPDPEPSTSLESPETITELTFVYAGGDPLIKELISERVQKFNAQYPDYKIIEKPSGAGGYLDYLKIQDAIGQFPDMLDSRDTDIWVDSGKIAELPKQVINLFPDPPLYNDHYYVAPLSKSLPSHGIYYNKALFDQLGLEEPSTYSEFEALCDTILENGIAPIVQGGKDLWHMGFWWSHYWNEIIASDNAHWLADKRAGLTSFTDADIQAMLTKYASLYRKGYIEDNWLNTSDNQLVSYLLSEKAAMFFSGSWMINQVTEADPDFELGWFPVPDEEGNISLIYANNLSGFALSTQASQDPNKVQCFEAFNEFWFEEENYVPYLIGIVAAPSTQIDTLIEYDSPFPEEFNRALEKSVHTDNFWNGKKGDDSIPGGFRNSAYKAFQEMIIQERTTIELGRYLDELWDNEITTTK